MTTFIRSQFARLDKSFWIKLKFYSAHLLLSWCSSSWQFAVGLFFVILSPHTNLRLTSINQFLILLVVMFFIPLVGKWIDLAKRITAMRVSIFLDNAFVCLCCIDLFLLSKYWNDQEVTSSMKVLLAVGVILCCMDGVANIASAITLQRDWFIVMCDAGHADLSTLNAVMKQIDMVCNVVAPILTGYIMTSCGIQVTSIVLAGTFGGTSIVTCLLLNSVYNDEPSFTRSKVETKSENQPIISENAKPNQAGSMGQSEAHVGGCSNTPEGFVQNSTSIDVSSVAADALSVNKTGSCCDFNLFLMFRDGFKIYCSYRVKWAAFSLAMLYLTTLSFHFATNGYLLLHGMTETSIAIVTAASSGTGFLGTYIFLFLKRKVGLERGALFGILIQLVSITFSLVALWLPFAQSDHAFSCAKLGLGQADNCSGFVTLMVFCVGIIISRAGLWTFDLSVVQMIQESVPAPVRGRFNGFQHALQSAFEVKQIILVILFPEVSTYRWLGLVSYISVLSAFFVYLYYYLNTRKENRRSQTSDPIEDAS